MTKNIRKELKVNFPGVKFSVRKNHSDSLLVSWTDGPTEEKLKSITDKYKDSYFDSSQDMSVSSRSAFNVVYGGVGYLFLRREYTDVIIDKALKVINEKYGLDFDGEIKRVMDVTE